MWGLGRYWAAALSVAAHGIVLVLLLTEFTPQRLDKPPPEQVIEMSAPIPMEAALDVPPDESLPPAAEPLRETMVQPPPPDAPPPPPETPPPPPDTVQPPPPEPVVQQAAVQPITMVQPDAVPVEQPPEPEVAEIQEVAPVSDLPVEVAVSAAVAVAVAEPPPRPRPPPPPVRRVATPVPTPPTPVPPVAQEVARPVERPPAPPVVVTPPRPPAPPPDYLTALRATLERNKVYPRSAQLRRQQGTALLRFTISRDGRVLSYRIERSSGYELLDSEVEAMIRRASPLPAIPDTMAEAQLELVVPVVFALR